MKSSRLTDEVVVPPTLCHTWVVQTPRHHQKATAHIGGGNHSWAAHTTNSRAENHAARTTLLEQRHWWAANNDVRHGHAPDQGTKRSASDAGITDAPDSKKPRSSLEAAAETILRQDAELERLRAEIADLKRQLEVARRTETCKDLAECTVADMSDAGIVKNAS